MDFSSLPEPWNTIMTLIVGPVGAFVMMGLVIYFLWKLFREEQSENRANFSAISVQADAIKEMSTELKEWRTGWRTGVFRGPVE